MPSFYGSDDLVWVGGPGERFRVFVGFGDEAIDCGLEIDEGMEDAPFEAPPGEFGEETLDGIEPGRRGRREVEDKSLVAIKPGADLRMLMDSVVVEDDMDGFLCRNLGVDDVQKADEFLVPMALHIASDHRPVEHIQSGEEGRCAVAFVVVGHGAQTSFFHRQTRLGAVKGLDLAFLINGKHDGVGWRIDIETNDIPQFTDEVRIARELELPKAMGLQTMRSPDTPDRAFTDTNRRGHHQSRPMGRLGVRVRQRQCHDAVGHVGGQGRNARRARFVPQKAINAFFHETLLPTPDAGLRFTSPAHDLMRSNAVRAEKNDGRPPHMFLGGATVLDNPFKTKTIRGTDFDRDSSAHAPDPQMRDALGIPKRTLLLGGDH